MLEGTPGIGKTTLWLAGLELARARGFRVLSARPAAAERELSFSALGDLLGEVLAETTALPEPRRRALSVALLLEEASGPPPDARSIGVATRDLLRLAAGEQPLLVGLDDAQWLDPPSREALEFALRRLDGSRVRLLCTARADAEEVLSVPGSERFTVGPLSLGALRELLHSRLGVQLPRPTLVTLHETAAGNPLFALELASALGGDLPPAGEPLPLPRTLGEVVAARLERVRDQAAETLLAVAVLARPTISAVVAAVGDPAAQELQLVLDAGVVEADGDRLRFTHPLLAAATLAKASHADRRRMHRTVVDLAGDAEERARHLGAAAEGPDPDVAAALEEAAGLARRRGAPAAAAELAESAARLTPVGDAAEARRRTRAAADHLFAAGSTVRARDVLERALREAPRGRERAEVALQLVRLLDTHERAGVDELIAGAFDDAEGDPRLLARIHQLLAYLLVNEDWPQARHHARISLGHAEQVDDPVLLVAALSLAGVTAFWCGDGIDHDGAVRGIALESALPQLPLDSRPSSAYAFQLKWAGDVEQARPLYEQLRVEMRGEGDAELGGALFYSAFHELISENWEQAARFADEAHEVAVLSERTAGVAFALDAQAIVAAHRGDVAAARSGAAAARSSAEAMGLPAHLLGGWAIGLVELTLGEAAAALPALRTATDYWLASGAGEPNMLSTFPLHVEAAVALGELAEARDLLDWVEPRAEKLDRAWSLACAARGRALLAEAAGDEAGADVAFARAYEQHERWPQQWRTYELARTQLAHGTILRRRRRGREAHELLDHALASFERLGARLWAEQTRSELARIGSRAAAAGRELTETERRIAALAIEGRSNKEIAAALHLSPKTVEWNLSRIYAKLGVRSRAQLAARAATGDRAS